MLYEQLSKERKEQQALDALPEWFTTLGWQMFKDKYLYNALSYRGQLIRIAETAAYYMPKRDVWKQRFFDIMWNGWLAPSTPVLANMGTDRGMPISCSGGYIPDSIDGFYTAQHETALLTQQAFGTSAYLGDIRPRGSSISGGGKASGILPVFKDFVQLSQDVSQGGIRRGAWAGYVSIEHDDFWEIVSYILNEPDDCNVGWNIHDSFIEKLEAEEPEAIKRLQEAMYVKCVTGRGYFFFVDKVNRSRPVRYEELELLIKASNLCVAPETEILTSTGYQPIWTLANKEVQVWNGREWSKTVVRKTGENQKLIKVITNSSQELECTEYHKFYVQKDYHKPAVEVRASDLKVGDKLIKFDLPVIQGGLNLTFAYENGFFSGDGCHYKGKNMLYFYGDKKDLIEHCGLDHVIYQDAQNRAIGYCKHLQPKFFVPGPNYLVSSRLRWLAGLLDADGTVSRNGTNESLQIGSVNKNFLKEVQMMLQTLGIQSKVTFAREEGLYKLPANDGTGQTKKFKCKEINRLLISSTGLYKLSKLGLKCNRLQWEVRKPQRCAEQFIKVVGIVDEGRYDDTYCFTEPKRHMGMFNGLLTGQCTEITLPSDEDHTFTCVLSSMNLAKYDEWKDTDAVFWATVFLDCVAEDFINRGSKIKGLERAVRFTRKSRALGLGTLGFHTYLQQNNIAIESLEAHFKNMEIYKHLHDESLRASQWMAQELGEPEWCKGHGVRNSHRCAIAPNTSSALICGSVSQGIEPVYQNVYTQGSASGDMYRINPVLLEIMKEKGVYNKKVLEDIASKQGSVQHVDWLDDHQKLVFKTAFEIDQKTLIRLASARQQYICQAQSLNLFFNADEDEQYIMEVHKEAFLDPNIKSLYYMRSLAGVQTSKECLSCEG